MKAGSILIIGGLVLLSLGLLIKGGVPLGNLPGDINIKGDNFQVWIPITSALLLSVLASVLIWIYNLLA